MVRFIGIGVAVLLLNLVRTGTSVVQAEGTVSTIKADEHVVFFPTAAHLSTGDQTWTLPVHGWIFEPEENDVLRQWIIGEIENMFEFDLDPAKAAVFSRRLRPFLVDNERGKEIAIRIAGAEHTLPASGRDGHFWGTIELPAATVEPLLENGRLTFHAIMRPDDPRNFSGVVHCPPPTGILVISDIDDTIKVTDVRKKREVIENTFREFRPIDGMSKTYRDFAGAGASFHYVSSSPWQLYEPLAEFNRAAGYPDTIFHLKRFRVKDSSFLSLFANPFDYKISVITPIIESFPQHQFVLIGDSGEKDPEAYAAILRRFPIQVLRIYIRDVTAEPADAPRYRETFSDIAPEKWQVFTDPAKLKWPEAATSR